ncbi:MAG: phosphoglucosamine mutase [Calditrichaeota bacterium]|nr:phosphoglucosamine mutase [Calditrichota bacterium]
MNRLDVVFDGLMTSVSGVRGIVGEGLTVETVVRWATAFGVFCNGGRIVQSRDTRPTGPMIADLVAGALAAAGCDVDDAGVLPTPAGALAVHRRGAAGGIIITASHNPQEWNAMKFVRADGRMLTAPDFASLKSLYDRAHLPAARWDGIGRRIAWNRAGEIYIGAVLGLGLLDLDRIRRKRFRVAFDGVNGAGSELYPLLLESLGCEVKTIHSSPDGYFPRPPEPSPDNIADLRRLVVEEKCSIGFAVDPDGDRLAVVDERGAAPGEERTLALAVGEVLRLRPGPVVINALTSQVIVDVAGSFGVTCQRSKVGEANVADLIADTNAVVGGEGNGGVMLAELHLVRDAGVGMALLLNRLASGRKPLSEHLAVLPEYSMRKATWPVEGFDPAILLDELAAGFPATQVSRLDGVRIESSDGWVQARSSNTEPILRIYSEASQPAAADAMLSDMLARIGSFIGRKASRVET